MPRGTSGLLYDLNLVKRRAWLFLPFLVLGVLVAFSLNSVAGDANATATLQLDTIVYDAVIGGDRGLRVFEAQSMTTDDRFKARVRERIGDENFDYSRFAVSLLPISIADGVSRGNLTVTVTDTSLAEAERFRQAWVDTFLDEYNLPEGLYRKRFLENTADVAADAEKNFQALYAELKPQADAKGVSLDVLLGGGETSLPYSLNAEEARVIAELAETQGAARAYATSGPSAELAAVASSILGQPVDAANALAALNGHARALQASLDGIRQQRTAISDGAFDGAFLQKLSELRGAREIRQSTFIRHANARIAVKSAESDAEVSYSFSGGVAGSNRGRVAVAIAITVVFGLIAIYTVEWLSQLRRQGDN